MMIERFTRDDCKSQHTTLLVFRCRLFAAAGLFSLVLTTVPAPAQENPANSIGAVGHIVPATGVVEIFGAPGSRVTSVPAHAGQTVRAGTLLMTTQGVSPETDPTTAKVQLSAARDLATQQVAAQASVVRLAELHNSQAASLLATYRSMGSTLVSQKELVRLRNAATEARLALDVERTKLTVLTTQTQTALQTAQRQFDLATHGALLTAPFDGTVLRINRQPGEQLTNDPAIEFADLRTMYVVCEVFEGDLLRLRPGMGAIIKAQALPDSLHGKVEDVGRLVEGRTRLGEVRVRLDKAEPANRLVGMEVEVTIER